MAASFGQSRRENSIRREIVERRLQSALLSITLGQGMPAPPKGVSVDRWRNMVKASLNQGG